MFFFFFQAEDGIRDHCVTGVQTCALPILGRLRWAPKHESRPIGQPRANVGSPMPTRANARCDLQGGFWESRGGERHPSVGLGVDWRSPLARVIVACVRQYQRIAPPGLRASCRYTPTCSEYAI